MISRLDGVAGIGRDYVTALLQLHLGIAFWVTVVQWMVGANAEFRERLRTVPWQAAAKAVESAAAPLLLLAAYALVQLQAEAMSFLHLVALIVAGLSVLVATLLTIFVPVCGGGDAVRDDSAETGEDSPQSFAKLTKFLNFLSVLKAMGQLLLLSAAFPGVDRSQLACASALARLALFTEAVEAILRALGFEDGALILACTDIGKVLSSTTLVSGIAIMADMQLSEDVWSLPFQPIFYCTLGLCSLVGIALVADFGCGGGCLAGSGSRKRELTIQFVARGVFVIGLLISIGSIAKVACSFELQQTGLRVEWGEPLAAIAVTIASLALLTELVDLLSDKSDMDALPVGEDSIESHKKMSPGIAEPMSLITSRASCLILALIATQIAVRDCPEESLDAYSMALTSPFRLGFLLCACVMFVQIFLLVSFSVSNRDMEPAPVPEMDATGTVVWDVIGDRRGYVLQLLLAGLLMGIVSMGISACSLLGVVVIGLVYPFLSQQGKSNVNEALGCLAAVLKSCFGVIGKRVDRYLEERRKLAAEKAAQREALREKEIMTAAERADDGEKEKVQKKNKSEPGEPKKKQPNPSPKKAANKGAKKKSTM